MKKEICFTVEGHPVPYLRMTQAQVRLLQIPNYKLSLVQKRIKTRVKDYLDWKEFVKGHTYGVKFNRRPKKKVYLDIYIYFQNKRHGDPDNYRKGIQDALFENDKYVAGKVDFFYDEDAPRVEIEIIEEKTMEGEQ